MKTFKTGSKVSYGIYLSIKAFDVRFVGADSETLNGRDGAEYIKLPSILLIALAPALGGLFVLAFPLIVLGMVAAAAVKMISQTVQSTVENNAHMMNLRWEPSATYLNRKEAAKKDAEKTSEQKKS